MNKELLRVVRLYKSHFYWCRTLFTRLYYHANTRGDRVLVSDYFRNASVALRRACTVAIGVGLLSACAHYLLACWASLVFMRAWLCFGQHSLSMHAQPPAVCTHTTELQRRACAALRWRVAAGG